MLNTITTHLPFQATHPPTHPPLRCPSGYFGIPNPPLYHTDFVFLSEGTAISWGSKLQRLAALSTVEAEFVAMSSGVQEALWLGKLVHDVGEDLGAAVILSDNTGALANVRGIPISPRTKHIGVRYHRMRGEVVKGNIDPQYIHTSENIADMFTKTLPKALFVKLREMSGMK